MKIIWTSKYKTYSLHSYLAFAFAVSILALVVFLGFLGGIVYQQTNSVKSQLTPIVVEEKIEAKVDENKIIDLNNPNLQKEAVENAINNNDTNAQIKALSSILAELKVKLATIESLHNEIKNNSELKKQPLASDLQKNSFNSLDGKGGRFEPVSYLNETPSELHLLLEDSSRILDRAIIFEARLLSSQYQVIQKDTNSYFIPSVVPSEARISSTFGVRVDPLNFSYAMHRGIDFAAPTGTPIYAAAAGVVELVRHDGAYGNHLKIAHDSEITSLYAHTSKILVNQGDLIQKGQLIAYIGATGRVSGPHLHFEIHRNGEAVNPTKYIDVGGFASR